MYAAAARWFCTVLAVAALTAVATAFTGIPGYVKPRFTVLSSTNGAEKGGAGARTDSARWQVRLERPHNQIAAVLVTSGDVVNMILQGFPATVARRRATASHLCNAELRVTLWVATPGPCSA